MTNNQILTLAVGLPKVSPPDMNGDFNYAISANLQEAKRVSVSIREAIKDSKPVEEYRKQLHELQEKYAEKDENGKPISSSMQLPNGTWITQYNIPSFNNPNGEFNKLIAELEEKYKKDLEKQNQRMKMLENENKEFKPVLIDRKDIPKGLTREEMDLIFPLIKKK